MNNNFPFKKVQQSLTDIVGESYITAVCAARAALSGEDVNELIIAANKPVDWYPAEWHNRLLSRLPDVGKQIIAGAPSTAIGATSRAFAASSKRESAPVSGYGFYRVGEDGHLYLTTKSEHYHAPVGHSFPGYALLETARHLGIPNATHNNTRGHITRLLEEKLVAAAHGVSVVNDTISSDESLSGLNRVLNLETGSLAVEAGVKMMLARHYRIQPESPEPKYHDRIPVLLVMGNDDGGMLANYHGTTVITQMMRGMWPEIYNKMEDNDLLRICPVRPNSIADLNDAFARYDNAPYKIAGFLHEIVMMNYGAKLLSQEFLNHTYKLCAKNDVPTLVDEIQSCLWAPGLFLFREYGLKPSAVALGKGFPGGEYPASKLLFSAALDTMPQFGALVTNGQEELASLAYLVTMRWASENEGIIREIGDEYETGMRQLAEDFPDIIAGITGSRHLLGIEFHNLAAAKIFTSTLNCAGFDISAQTYKAECPPVALTKLPITACNTVVDFVIKRMTETFNQIKATD